MPSIPLIPNIYERTGPVIDRSLIPSDQMPPFLHIVTLLAELALYERQLLTSVYLYEYSTRAASEIPDFKTMDHALWTTGAWSMTAARDGALTIYHFGCAIEGLKASLPLCPALNALVDRQQLKSAGKIFKAAFPGDIAIRHVVAHVADFSMTPDEKARHAVKGPFTAGGFGSTDPQGVTWLRGNLNDNSYTITYEGKAFTYELSAATVAKLRSIKERVYSAFGAATLDARR